MLHAPRQTGKNSALVALRDELNASGQYRAVYVNVEPAQTAREDVHIAMQTILSRLASAAKSGLEDSFVDEVWPQILNKSGGHGAFQEVLQQWSASSPLPLVLMIDEIDAPNRLRITWMGAVLMKAIWSYSTGRRSGPGIRKYSAATRRLESSASRSGGCEPPVRRSAEPSELFEYRQHQNQLRPAADWCFLFLQQPRVN